MVNIREYYEKDGQMLPGKRVRLTILLSSSRPAYLRRFTWPLACPPFPKTLQSHPNTTFLPVVSNTLTLILIFFDFSQVKCSVVSKQGISLVVPQYNALLSALPEIEAALAAMGESVERPIYRGKPVVSFDGAKDEDEADIAADAKGKKKNFEQTSEEEV